LPPDDERAARDQRWLLNRPRQDLLTTFPAALQIASDGLGAPTNLRLLERWPTVQGLAPAASREELIAFACSCKHGWPTALQLLAIGKQRRPGAADGRASGRRRPAAGEPSSRARTNGAELPWRRGLPELSRPR
jgi:hypothetical protein